MVAEDVCPSSPSNVVQLSGQYVQSGAVNVEEVIAIDELEAGLGSADLHPGHGRARDSRAVQQYDGFAAAHSQLGTVQLHRLEASCERTWHDQQPVARDLHACLAHVLSLVAPRRGGRQTAGGVSALDGGDQLRLTHGRLLAAVHGLVGRQSDEARFQLQTGRDSTLYTRSGSPLTRKRWP